MKTSELYKFLACEFEENNYKNIIKTLNEYFEKGIYNDRALGHYISSCAKLGLTELGRKYLKLMIEMFPNYYSDLDLVYKYIDFRMTNELEELIYKLKFDSKTMFGIAKKCYFFKHYELAKKLFEEILVISDDEVSLERTKDYLRKIKIYLNDKNAFPEVDYSCFKKDGKILEPQLIVYADKIRDTLPENKYCNDPKKDNRPYMIWKIEDDKLYCFPVTKRVKRNGKGTRAYVLYAHNYKVRNIDRTIKSNLVCLLEKDVERVIDRVHDNDFVSIKKDLYIQMCFGYDMCYEQNKLFINDMLKSFNIKTFDIIKVVTEQNKSNSVCKSYFILDIDEVTHEYTCVEVKLSDEKTEIVDYNIVKIPIKIPIIPKEESYDDRKILLTNEISNSSLINYMNKSIVLYDDIELIVILNKDGYYLCIDKFEYLINQKIKVIKIPINAKVLPIGKINNEEYKNYLELLNNKHLEDNIKLERKL